MLNQIFKTTLAVVSVLSLFSSCDNSNGQVKNSIAQRGELIVAMDAEMPGYFVLGGESYGYQYDLLQDYADYLGVDLRVVSGKSSLTCAKMLQEGEVDIVTSLTMNLTKEEVPLSVPIHNTSYTLLCSKKRAKEVLKSGANSVTSIIGDGKLLVSAIFQSTKAYDELLDSLPQAHIYVSSKNSIELIEELSSGTYDYVICENSEAQLGCALTDDAEKIYTFSEQLSVSAVVSDKNTENKKNFEEWIGYYRGSEEYATLNYLYFDKGIVYQVTGKGLTAHSVNGISAYDKIFKQICDQEGYDWRLISAIAYNESRFKPNVVSNKGARGLMQVMPRVARQFDVKGDIMSPENNVLLGVKILGKIEKSLQFKDKTSQEDRMKIILACYNAGIGHVLDARNLARKYGANPDSWLDVSEYLTLKADPEIATDAAVKCGRFNSSKTLAYVKDVVNKYQSYCNNIAR